MKLVVVKKGDKQGAKKSTFCLYPFLFDSLSRFGLNNRHKFIYLRTV
jgi:hypothetical protein